MSSVRAVSFWNVVPFIELLLLKYLVRLMLVLFSELYHLFDVLHAEIFIERRYLE